MRSFWVPLDFPFTTHKLTGTKPLFPFAVFSATHTVFILPGPPGGRSPDPPPDPLDLPSVPAEYHDLVAVFSKVKALLLLHIVHMIMR